MNNGQIIVGEIKLMENGTLEIETDFSESDFLVEWSHVKSMKTLTDFVIILNNDSRLKGTISRDPINDEYIIIYPTNGSKLFARTVDIVYLKSIKNGFWDRMKGSIGGGMNLTKASKTQQYSLNGSLAYYYTNLNASVYLNFVKNNTQDTIQTKRTNYGTNWRVFVNKKWFVLGAGDFLQSDEQNLKLRTTVQLGYGTYPIRTHKMYLSTTAGIALNTENYTTENTETTGSMETFLELEYNAFSIKDLDVVTKAQLFTRLADKRFRFVYTLDFKIDLPLDFYIGGNVSFNYDTDPNEQSSNTDYVIGSTVGWKF